MLGRNINLEEVDEKVLYHYTKSNGINGIMNNKCFWATKNDFLNDPNEFSYVNKILREVCSDYIPDQKKLEMFLSDINDNGSGAEYFVLHFHAAVTALQCGQNLETPTDIISVLTVTKLLKGYRRLIR